MEQCGGSKEKVKKERREGGEERENEDGEIRKEEVIEQLKKMKIWKAPGEDGLENEAWKYMPVSIGKEVWRMIGKIWKEGGIPGERKKRKTNDMPNI